MVVGHIRYIGENSLQKPNILGFKSGYNARQRAGKSAHLDPKLRLNLLKLPIYTR
jgi:hypothetical protein